jgi:deoxyribodipyrimidine photo-lyase
VWLRQCFRLQDNPLFHQAQQLGHPVVVVYIHSHEDAAADWKRGEANAWWLHNTLEAHQQQLESHYQQPLHFFSSPSAIEVLTNIKQHLPNFTNLISDERWEPWALTQQATVQAWANMNHIALHWHNTSLLQHPTSRATKQGNPFQVFTPFWKQSLPIVLEGYRHPLPAVSQLPKDASVQATLSNLEGATTTLDHLNLKPRLPWAESLASHWQAGEVGASACLTEFLAQALFTYADDRNHPAQKGTSRLSPYLQIGAISPNQILQAVLDVFRTDNADTLSASARHYVSELGWREFSHHLLTYFPHTPSSPLRPEFKHFPWQHDAARLKRWQQGQTGVPIVDAGMRELWHTGWMHNRVRMIVASYLVKNLQQPWQAGAAWFWDTLIDADLAQNTQGWQWTAGCGADAAPYFRIFNPVLQGKKFDPEATYVKRWLPELAHVPNEYIHEIWEAKPALLRLDGVTLGETYPYPLVDLGESRQQALAAYDQLKQGTEKRVENAPAS